MLAVNPVKRITATDALKHPWICVSPTICCVLHAKLIKNEIWSYNKVFLFLQLRKIFGLRLTDERY